eukprot:CAMPEP_0119356496 /NCGR_PEP_ID=MMETSP1334-20130426/5087_1 /TAXON_ID=127549 /ORGANISM="Calcidiscus leptoporus, Strain RCC1130" /LENGTH=80 /DNA_ID=CAMNT_0007370543 /DNA_START=372 /DNA_END=611 /DNA_ORIENTATION=-
MRRHPEMSGGATTGLACEPACTGAGDVTDRGREVEACPQASAPIPRGVCADGSCRPPTPPAPASTTAASPAASAPAASAP